MAEAERLGQAREIDEHVLTRTLMELSRVPTVLDALARCHVNVSGQSAGDPRFRTFVEAALDTAPGLSGKLCFELTETASIDRLSEALAFAQAVRRRGCLVALDDFGTGLSSFAHLKALPIDIVKIDGLFVRDIVADPFDRNVVCAIAEVCRARGQITIAEWAESPAIVECLRGVGIDAAQGHAIHRPCPLDVLLGDAASA
jgi:EAL domain-containing protein (putative c-di-GMP-specific phosphodiesterase class I)